ncbi:MAG TPA: SIMPL domain-containing protein [Steroidobacteraceae bacterium]|nr:SIMPL domain-containing protein [Steroidobacteraceae bacterium]
MQGDRMRLSCSNRWCALSTALLCIVCGAPARALAQDDRSLAAQIVASGTAEVTIPATTASFSVEATSLASSGAAASAASARIAKAISEALQAAHLSREEIAQSQLTVAPRWEYDETTHKQKRTGYEATMVIRIETGHLDRLGAYLDAALNAGATGISEVSFSAKDSNEARRRALAEAVGQAKADAEAIARAGGGTLGPLVLLSTEPQNLPRGVGVEPAPLAVFSRMAEAAKTTIIPSQIRVTAAVVGRWSFVPGAAGR